jgi:CheY-like chemotaxis protein
MRSTEPDVLVVDDDPDMRELTIAMVSAAGFPARGARHGAEALEKVAEQMPGLILLDMLMPVMDGWQFAEVLRARYGRGVPIVVTTAAENALERGRDVGAVDVLAKPFELSALMDVVRRHLASGHPAAHHHP